MESESRTAEITKGPKGGMVLSVGDHRYQLSQKAGTTIYWRCINRYIGCNARVTTYDGNLISENPIHICDRILKRSSDTEDPLDVSSIANETTENAEQSNISSVIVKSKRKTVLTSENYKYRCQARKGCTSYWQCMQEECKARAITENGRLTAKFGTHVCAPIVESTEEPKSDTSGNCDLSIIEPKDGDKPKQSHQEIVIRVSPNRKTTVKRKQTSQTVHNSDMQQFPAVYIPPDTPVIFERSMFGNEILVLRNFKYHRTHRTVNDRGYWTCNQRHNNCKARAVTWSGRLVGTSGIHICVPLQETDSSPEKEQRASQVSPNTVPGKDPQDKPTNSHFSTSHAPQVSPNKVSRNDPKDKPPTSSRPSTSHIIEKSVKPRKTTETYEVGEPSCKKARMSYEADATGRKSIFINGIKFRRTHNVQGSGREYWQCARSACPAKAITVNKRLKRVYGEHDCGVSEDPLSLKDNDLDSFRKIEQSISSEEKLADISKEGDQENVDPNSSMASKTELAGKMVSPKRNSKNSVLILENRRYSLNRSSSKIGKLYWRCARKGCRAGVITLKSRFKRTFGNHVCGTPKEEDGISNIRADSGDPTLLFTFRPSGTLSLSIGSKNYKRTHCFSKTDTVYWQCMASEDCPAKVVTEKGLFKKKYGVHICEAANKTHMLEMEESQNLSIVDDDQFSQSSFSTLPDEDEDRASSHQRMILRQKNSAEAFLDPIASTSLQSSKKRKSISVARSDFPSPSTSQKNESCQRQLQKVARQEKARRKKEKVPKDPGTNGYKKNLMKINGKKSFASLEERVKNMPHLQPRVMVSRFLTAALDKVSERMKWANELAIEADRLHSVNIVSIANLSLSG